MLRTKIIELKTFVIFEKLNGEQMSQEVQNRSHDDLDFPACTISYFFCEAFLVTLPNPETGELIDFASKMSNFSPRFIRRGRVKARPGPFGLQMLIMFGPNGLEPTHEVVAECLECGKEIAYPCFLQDIGNTIVIREQTP